MDFGFGQGQESSERHFKKGGNGTKEFKVPLTHLGEVERMTPACREAMGNTLKHFQGVLEEQYPDAAGDEDRTKFVESRLGEKC